MVLPSPRGPISERLLRELPSGRVSASAPSRPDDALTDEDLQLSLWVCNELSYRGFLGVPAEAEWDVGMITLRTELEHIFLAALQQAVAVVVDPDAPVPEQLQQLVDADDGPALSTYLERTATLPQFHEFIVHRSIYHLKEADPHSWAIPRLSGEPKAALVAIQSDEYGNGITARMHAELFRVTMRELGLDDGYGAYLDDVPGITLAISNLMSMFGLHRRWRGALVGHLAVFEMTSSLPNASYSKGLRRLGGSATARRFFDEHTTADALHEQLAMHDLCGALVDAEPELAPDVLFGAACCLHLDALFAEYVLDRWAQRQSSLRTERGSLSTAS